MNLTRWFFLLLIARSVLTAAEPAEFDVMLRGYCYAGNAENDPKALGGYGGSDNLPKRLQSTPSTPDLYLEIMETPVVVFAERYAGLQLRLVNGGKETATMAASDSRLQIVQEAQDADGTWKEVEYLPSSWCGNSYHSVYLAPGHYWQFVAPKYSGPQKAKLRFKLTVSGNRVLYSPAYEGGIHPAQFTAKAGHAPKSIMDPYNE